MSTAKKTTATKKTRVAKTKETKSKLYNGLSNTDATFNVRTTPSTKAGVRVISRGAKKASRVEIVVPSTTIDGSPRVVKLTLTGRQARALFETLDRHYNK